MDLYKFSFIVLAAANVGLGYLQYRTSDRQEKERQKLDPSVSQKGGEAGLLLESAETSLSNADKKAAYDFLRNFFQVYVFVVAADWLQGPYLYSLYRDEKGLSERVTAILFACGFVSAGISAGFVGAYADEFGRKRACLGFCLAYAISCFTMISNTVPILFLGRVLGGISTTLMYSVFDTWMVHEFHAQEMSLKGLSTGKIFGWMTTVSSIVAVLSGVMGETIVSLSGTKVAPFMVALLCLAVAFLLISHSWSENYGSRSASQQCGLISSADIATITQDKRIVSLGLICCLFEGTMYLFVFFWSAALKFARSTNSSLSTTTTTSAEPSSPPFGLVFATFMAALMLGSQLFTIMSTESSSSQSPPSTASFFSSSPLNVTTAVHTLGSNILLAAASLLAIVTFGHREDITLWAFCIFEACVGMYYPSMGYLKGQIVHDGMRGKVYGLLRLPLNVFVVVALALTKEGARHRDNVFLACTGLLLVAYIVSHKYLASPP